MARVSFSTKSEGGALRLPQTDTPSLRGLVYTGAFIFEHPFADDPHHQMVLPRLHRQAGFDVVPELIARDTDEARKCVANEDLSEPLVRNFSP